MANQIEVVKDNKYYSFPRLPVDLVPEHYKLTLTPDLKNCTFNGTVEIIFGKTENKVSEIILNAIELEIKDGHLTTVDGTKIMLKKVTYDSDHEVAALKFNQDNFVAKNLTLEFSGILNDKMRGFYQSSFKLEDKDVKLATTQFEPCDARRSFPCFDEPALKATFDVTMIYDDAPITFGGKSYKQIALSNGSLISESKSADGKTIAVFETSPKMSTYLLAFIIGPFGYIEAKAENGCKVRVYTTPGKESQGKFSLNVACKSLDFYEKYFDVKFPLSKMDLVAIPDFKSGAMENWGLVTYRETALLVDDNLTATLQKQNIAITVSHETAHQWFGNLVTMVWWNDLWLNEGFATFMEYLCTDNIFPEWDLWAQFSNDAWSSAMSRDALHNSHPIEVPVNFACEVDEIFDAISYEKGSSIIRMLYDYIGDDCFRKGMKDYLNKYAYKNAATKDLWDCLGKASNKPIASMMSTWTDKMGYPWIKLDVLNTNENGDVTISLEQERFVANGKLDQDAKNQTWMVPISIMSESSVDKQLLDAKKKTFVLPKQGDQWFKLNKNSIGFYRIAYPQAQLDKLIEVIQADFNNKATNPTVKPRLSAEDRMGIQTDYFALCRAGHIQTSDLLKLLACFEDETNYTVWQSINTCVLWLSVIFRNDPYKDGFAAFVQKLYGKIYSRLTWEVKKDDCHTDAMLRSMVINTLISYDYKDAIENAQKLFQAQLNDNKSIPADLRGAVYQSIAMYGPDKDFDELFNIRRKVDLSEEKNRISRAMGKTKDPKRLERVASLIFSDEVRDQDKVTNMVSIGISNPKFAWGLFKKNHDHFKRVYGPGHTISMLISYCTQYSSTEIGASEVDKFFKNDPCPGAERAIQQSIENITLNTEWLARLALDTQVMKFFSKYLPK